MTKAEGEPEVIECDLRLHSSRPAEKAGGELTWADWSQTVVGHAVTFQALANPGAGTWNGPLPPGAEIASPQALDDPHWTIFLPRSRGVPLIVGKVGHPLAIGEAFHLPPGQPGMWTANVVFDGAIVTD